MPGGLGRSQTALLGLLIVAHQYCILVLLSFILSRSTSILIDKTMQICRKTGSQAPKSTAAQDGPKPWSGSGGLSGFFLPFCSQGCGSLCCWCLRVQHAPRPSLANQGWLAMQDGTLSFNPGSQWMEGKQSISHSSGVQAG